jgi:hypothetical protein
MGAAIARRRRDGVEVLQLRNLYHREESIAKRSRNTVVVRSLVQEVTSVVSARVA